MFGSQMLDVAIGVVFVYALLSLVCSTINEWIAGLFSLRAGMLEEGVQNLLTDSNLDLAQDLYDHPLIRRLSRKGHEPAQEGENIRPAYIPSGTFSQVLLDLLVPVASADAARTFDEVREAVEGLPDGEVKKMLLVHLEEARGDLDAARQNIQRWFNSTMQQVSAWYKRRAQFIIVGLALVVSVLLNADTIMIGNTLWRDPVVRSSVVAAAQTTVSGAGAEEDMAGDLGQVMDQVRERRLPIGWTLGADSAVSDDVRVLPTSLGGWLYKVAGLLITAVAVSLGAPFWFDLLNRLVNLRSEGTRPDEES